MNKRRFIVKAELDYIHRITAGVEAENEDDAQERFSDELAAGNFFENPGFKLLDDEYEELECVADPEIVKVLAPGEDYPAPGDALKFIQEREQAMEICRGLVRAYEGSDEDLMPRLEALIAEARSVVGDTGEEEIEGPQP